MKRSFGLTILVLATALAGCSNDPVDPGTGGGTGGLFDYEACGGSLQINEIDYGTDRGDVFAPFDGVSTCAGGAFDFYGANEFFSSEMSGASISNFCDTSYTVVIMSAGWCGPCRAEAQEIEAILNEGYASANVRVVQMLIENNEGATPSQAFCDEWQSQYNLTNPVLIDTGRISENYFALSALPGGLIVDSNGEIVYRFVGSAPALSNITGPLDELLGR